MVQEVFQRLEKKYLMTEAQYGRLMLAAGGRLQKDEYGEYQISNIYFDTPDFLLVRRSLESRFIRKSSGCVPMGGSCALIPRCSWS